MRICAVSCVFASCGFALFATQQAEREFTLTTDANLVLLDVSVRDRAGRHVSDLGRENFRVWENGKPQTVSQFAREDQPVTVGLVIDDSGSMRSKRDEVTNAAMTFIGSSNPRDEVFVVHFNDRVRAGLPEGVAFSDNPALLRASLLRNPAEGRTALYDALMFSLKHLNAGRREKQALLLISDGGDNASRHNMNDVMDAVRESRATIYSVGIFDTDDPDRNPRLLRRLASVSGGVAYFPKELPEIDKICRQIAADIRERYTIGYVPDTSGNVGDLRNIKVSAAKDDGKFTVRARSSYRFPAGAEK